MIVIRILQSGENDDHHESVQRKEGVRQNGAAIVCRGKLDGQCTARFFITFVACQSSTCEIIAGKRKLFLSQLFQPRLRLIASRKTA